MDLLDGTRWNCVWTLEKWSEEACDFVRKALGFAKGAPVASAWLYKKVGAAEELIVVPGNLALNEGIAQVLDLAIAATSSNKFDNANSRIGIGDSTTAETASQTDLQAASNKTYKAMNATFPSRAAQTVTFKADFTSGDANYHWQEWVVDNGGTSGLTLNRKVQDNGTKATGTWTPSAAITLA
jgi:hypothetical protein